MDVSSILPSDILDSLRNLTQSGKIQWKYHASDVCDGAWDATYNESEYCLIKRPLGPWEMQINNRTHYLWPKGFQLWGVMPWTSEGKLIAAIRASAHKITTANQDYHIELKRRLGL